MKDLKDLGYKKLANLDEWGIPIQKVAEAEVLPVKAKKKTLFEVIGTTYNKRYFASDEDINSTLNEYMLANILSNHPATVFLADYINTHNIPLTIAYRYVYHTIPKGVISNIPYPSKKKVPKALTDNEMDAMCRHYRCNEILASRYARMLPESELNNIVGMYAEGGTERKLRKKKPKKKK